MSCINTSESDVPATLYTYFRSSASYRVRIALNLKGLAPRHVPVHLNRGGGEQFGAQFRTLNPQALVPVYSDDVVTLSQSLAIMEYLDERHPERPLLPASIAQRAHARQIALAVSCDIHPLNNLRVLKYLTSTLGASEQAKSEWIHHWIGLGLQAIEEDLARAPSTGAFCVGDRPTIADCCLVPQVVGAQRFGVDLTAFPRITAICDACNALEAFVRAHPGAQPDAE